MTTVIYHSADFDGIFCREIARKFLPEAELIGWNFGDPLIPFPTKGQLYILDLSAECLSASDIPDDWKQRTIWIDHHKTSMEKWTGDVPGYRIDGVAACRLAWQWFSTDHTDPVVQFGGLPEKQAFIERTVSEPLAVRLAGEYDIWDKRDPRAETFQYGLRSKELTPEDWKWLLTVRDNMKQGEYDLAKTNLAVDELIHTGRILQAYQQKIDADLVTHRSYRLTWEGLNFIVLNTGRFNSLTYAALDKPETGHDALLGYMFNGKCWTVSLYHANHRKDIDLSEIAKKHGGGGHRGACGFTCDKLPFMA